MDGRLPPGLSSYAGAKGFLHPAITRKMSNT